MIFPEKLGITMSTSFPKINTRYIILDFLFTLIILTIILMIVLAIIGLKFDDIKHDRIFNLILGAFFVFGFALCIARRLKNNSIRSKYLIGDFPLRKLPWMMLLIVFYGIETIKNGILKLTFYCTNLAAPSFVKSELVRSTTRFSYETDSIALKTLFYILLFISVVIIAPLAEEFLVRGILLHRFSTKWGVSMGIIVSSLLFGLLHFNIASISIGVGYIFVALIYIRVPSLLVPISYHMMNNIIFFISKIVTDISGDRNETEITIKYLWLGLLNISFALPILFYFLKWPVSLDTLPYSVNSRSTESP